MATLEKVSIYDVALKGISVLRRSKFIKLLAEPLIGQIEIADLLSTEFSRIPKLMADYIARVGPEDLIHIEFQSGNDRSMQWRMLEYYSEIVRLHSDREGPGPRIHQIEVYVGRSRMAMEQDIRQQGLDYSFELVDIRKLTSARPILRASLSWGDRALSLLCMAAADSHEWRNLLGQAERLPVPAARQLVFWIWVFARLRPLEADLVREIEAMALHFNVSDDPIFRPAVDRAVTSALVDVVINWFDDGEMPLEEVQVEGLRLLPLVTIQELVRRLPRHSEPTSFLNQAISYSPMTLGE